MAEKRQKYILSLEKEQRIRLLEATKKIIHNTINDLDIKQLSWEKDLFRCRIWKYRIIYKKTKTENIIIKVWSRWDIYQ